MDTVYPRVLIISHKFDFGTDHVVYRLRERKINYWRLNRDELSTYSICFDPVTSILTLANDDLNIIIDPDKLKSIYYRAPTFLRDTFQNIDFEEQLKRSQWAAFIRSLSLFSDVKWVNNPVSTYFAEMKPVQLKIANDIGFKIPKTLIGNFHSQNLLDQVPGNNVVIKTVDTGYVTGKKKDGFIYTNFIQKNSLQQNNTRSIPFILQEALTPKVDIRVTIIGSLIFPVAITSDKPIDEDWRLKKYELRYEEIELPKNVSDKCRKLTAKLGINFGGIDLIKCRDEYYFIEINPTGEWEWLLHHTTFNLDKAIAEELITY